MTDTQPAVAATPEQTLVGIGDITLSKNWLVTPNASVPLRGTQIYLTDLSRTTSTMPTWAIVFAIIGTFFFLLGLLFLLVRESRTVGFVQVTVSNGTLVHMTQVPVSSVEAVAELHGRVAYARQLVAVAL